MKRELLLHRHIHLSLNDRNFVLTHTLCPYPFSALNQWYIMFTANLPHFIRPNAGLYFTNMRFTQEIHAQARLTNTAANA